jgi:hypothetical protein
MDDETDQRPGPSPFAALGAADLGSGDAEFKIVHGLAGSHGRWLRDRMVAMRRRRSIRAIPTLRMTAALLGCVLTVSGCAAPGEIRCTAAETAHGCAITSELFLGQTRRDGTPIPAAEWDAFLGEVVTPLFPAGLTVVDASGQWRNGDGRLGREPAKILVIVRAGGANEAAIAAIIADYKARFAQESVLRVDLRSAAWF